MVGFLLAVFPYAEAQAFQGNVKQLEESGQAAESAEDEQEPDEATEVEPEEVPAIFGFNGDLRILASSSTGDGIKTQIVERGNNAVQVRSAEITKGRDELSVKVTRTFGPDQREELLEAYPQLTEDAGGFPKEVEDMEIELTIGITRTFSAKDVTEFEQKYPAIFRQYRRQLAGRGRVNAAEAFRRRIVLPEVRGAPLPRMGAEAGPEVELKKIKEMLATAKAQAAAQEKTLEIAREEFGEEHPKTKAAAAANNVLRQKVDLMQEAVEGLERGRDQFELQKKKPELKESEDK
jgi:hypothetical protein